MADFMPPTSAWMDSLNRLLSTDFLALIAVFAPVHQGLIELFKLTGVKVRRYWEALLYVVYGNVYGPRETPPSPLLLNKPMGTIPAGLTEETRRSWWDGPQRRLIESFVLRAVGDDPVTDISDADIRNVIRIALMAAGPDCRQIVEGLDDMIRSGVRERADIEAGLAAFTPRDAAVLATVEDWKKTVEKATAVSPALLVAWREAFVEGFVPGVVRAERELGNAIKAAEYRYHRQLHWATVVFALAEAGMIAGLLRNGALGKLEGAAEAWSVTALPVVFFAAFGLLLVTPSISKSLTDALVGLGDRLRG